MAVPDAELWLVVAAVAGALVLALAALVAASLATRELRAARRAHAPVPYPLEDPVAARLRAIDQRLAKINVARRKLRFW